MFIETFQLLFTAMAVEAALILTLGFGTPVRRVVVKLLDLLKQGRGPLVTKTVAATMLVLFGSVMFSTIQINTRVSESGGVANATDQVMFANRLLESFLMGTVLFLALVIDRMHYYTRELQITRRNLEVAVKKTKISA
ncbi:Endoplasmic reticulum transmembrane protein [Hirschfeldia incana]|nr:Endoplasmic reticulum transmembrane protein [Hirschfeldia incana]